MARSRIETLLSLDQWAEVMGFDLWQFNQIGEGGGLTFGREAQCDTVWYQETWQRQFLSREEIALAIAKAEATLIPLLHYAPAPLYTVGQEVNYPNDYALDVPDWMTPRGFWKSVRLTNKRFCEVGTISRTLIEANKTYAESDADGDGVNDTFTITIATTETNADYIYVYYNAADRDDLDETWRIRPVRVSIAGGTATVTGKLAQITKPSLQLLPDAVPLSIADNVYAETLDVYQVKPDTTDIGTAYWMQRAVAGCYNSGSAAISGYDIHNAKQGVLRPVINGVYTYGRAPDRLTMNYLSGEPLLRGRMREPYAQMVAYLACAYLPALSCGCDRADQKLYFYRNSPTDTEQGTFPITLEQVNELNMPPVRGGFYAARQAILLMEADGVAI